MKATNKAWYWLAAGVLALGLNGYYHDGGLQGLHRLANNATATVAETKAQFSQVAMLADVAMATHARIHCPRATPNTMVAVNAAMPPQAEARLADLQVRLSAVKAARVQARVARLEKVMVQREMQRAEVELQNGRLKVLTNQGQVQIAWPRVQVNAPQAPVVDISEPN